MSRWKSVLVVVALLVVVILVWRALPDKQTAGGPRDGKSSAAVPVTVISASVRDVPLYLSALGTVQALNTVTVRPQVSGQLLSLEFEEGRRVAKGDVLAQIDPRTYQAQLSQAQARLRQNQALLASARATLQRYDELSGERFVSAQDLDNQRNTVAQMEAAVQADEAAIRDNRIRTDYTTVRAPIDGIAGIRAVDAGNILAASDPIVTLTQIHPINIVFTLPEQHLQRVRDAHAAGAVTVSAMDRIDSQVLADGGALSVIDNQIDASTGSFRLKSEFPNDDDVLWPGQFVNVRMRVDTVHDGLVVPTQAIQRGPGGDYVYVVGEDNTARMQPVDVAGEADDLHMLIASGLEAGERVVTEGQFRLKPGSAVTPLAPGEVPELPVAAPDDAKPARGRGR